MCPYQNDQFVRLQNVRRMNRSIRNMIKVQETVKRETLRIAAGTLVLTALMVAVFLILGLFEIAGLLGALLGCAVAVLNFFLLALSVQKAAEEMNGVQLPPLEENEENPDETPQPPISPQAAQAKKRMQLSYTGRMLLTVLLAVIALSVPCFNPIAALVPQLFPRLVIQIWSIRQKNGKGV